MDLPGAGGAGGGGGDASGGVGAATFGLIGSIIGTLMAQGEFEKIAALRKQAMDLYGRVDLPTLEKVAAQTMPPSELNKVKMDPRYKSAADDALQQLSQESKTGMNATDRNNLEKAQLSAMSYDRGSRQASQDRMNASGHYDSGAQQLGEMTAQQNGANQAYMGSLQTSSDASNRALQALQAQGQFASQLGQNDLSQQNKTADAADAIHKFNIGNDFASQNINNANRQTTYGDQMQKADRQNQQIQNEIGMTSGDAQRTKDVATGIGTGVGTSADKGYDMFMKWFGGGAMGG